MQHRQTSFGGFMSVVCFAVIMVLAVSLGDENLSPAYVSSISTETPAWNPHGTFRLTVVVHGSGFEDCGAPNSAIKIDHLPSDWEGIVNSTWTSAVDGSCTIVWQCVQCMIVSPSTVPLVLNASRSAWATYIEYTLDTPSFTSSALLTSGGAARVSDQSSEDATELHFSLQGVVVSGNMHSGLFAFRGPAESIISVLLTNFKVEQVRSNLF